MRRLTSRAVTLAALIWWAPAADAQQISSCTTVAKNIYVRDVMSNLYLWYREMPTVDPARYSSPEAYLEAVRYQPLDSRFSYVADRAATEALFSSSQYAGFGFSSTVDEAGALRLTQIFPDSPAGEAGLRRGDRLVEVNGESVDVLLASGRLSEAYGPPEAGVVGEVVVERAGQRLAASMTKRAVTIPTVSHTRTFDVNGRRVGYVFFRNFVEPSYDALAAAFAELRASRATEVVLDLRYNGGGLVNVAQYLGSLIGGARTTGQVFAVYAHNDRNAFRDETLRFSAETGALGLSRLVVVTTGSSASASELVINALRPFIPVITVGDRTYGKPVGQYAIPFCDKVLAPVSFQLRNADGYGDFFDGLPADCLAPDDLTAEIGDPQEGSLREALTVVATGTCSPAAAPSSAPQSARPRERVGPLATPRVVGWDAVLGAH